MAKRCLAIWLFLLSLLFSLPVQAQDDNLITYGATVSGRLTASNPRAAHVFEGLRGEVIGLALQVTAGDLDPMIKLVDDAGTIVAHYDDRSGSRVPQVPSFRIPRSARYTILVTRFGYELGSTTGAYDLTLERIGVSSTSGSTLRYGDQVINTINDMSPQLYYSFRAQRGDIINVRMRRVSGDLDPYLQVVDREAFVLADNDDTLGAPVPFDSTITGLVIEADGVYVIVASRYGQAAGTSAGNFVLTVEEADNSGLGNSPQTAEPLLLGSISEGELTNQQFAQYYRFEAQADDIVTIRMSRGASGALDAFLVLADAGLGEIISDDDSGGGQNAEISQYRIPANGTYYIIATRFEREAGTSSGAYRLELLSLGNAFDGVPDGVPRISPGTTITGRIDDTTPEISYAFWATAGDIVTVSMNRGDGNLDPVVSIEDTDGNTVARDDDSGGGQNARINAYTIPETGTYTIRATRYTGDTGPVNTAGSFVLVLARRLN